MNAIQSAEQAFRELGLRQKRTQEAGVALGFFCRSLELGGIDHETAARFYKYAALAKAGKP